MPRFVKYALTTIGTIVGLLVLVVVVGLLIPDDVYRDWLTDTVRSSTGRELTIDGDFDIQVGKGLSLEAGEVSLANADWGRQPALFTARRLNAEIELLPLLRGVVAVSLNADSPQVLLETDDSGRGNWEMGSGKPTPISDSEPPRDSTGIGVAIAPNLQMNDARFEYRDDRSGHTEQVDLSAFNLNTADERLTVDLKGQYAGQSISLSGDLGDTRRIASGETTEAHLKGQFNQTTLTMKGSWAGLLAASGPTLDLTLALNTPSTDTLTPFARITIPNLGALDLGSRISGAGGTYGAKDLQLSLDGPDTKIHVSGEVADLMNLEGVRLSVQANSESIPSIVDGLGLHLPVSLPQALDAKGELSGSMAVLALQNLVVQVRDQQTEVNITGSAEDILGQQGVSADLDLKAPSLAALSKFTGRELPASGPVEAKAHLVSRDATYKISPLDVRIAGEKINAKLSGSVADLLAIGGINLELDAHVGSLAQFSGVAGTELPETSPLEIRARATAVEGVRGPAQISGNLESDWLKGEINTTVADVGAAQGVKGEFNLELQSLAVLSALAGRELPPMGPIKVAGHLISVDKTYALTDLNLGIEDKTLRAQLKGSIADLLTASGIDLELDAQIGSLSNFSSLAGTELPETKPLSIKAKAIANKGALGPAQISADLQSDWLKANIQATIADLLAAQGIAGKLDAELQSLADLSSIAGRELPAMGPIKASANLASNGETYALTELNLGIEDKALQAQIKGSIADLLAVQGIDLAMDGTVSSLADLSPLTGTELPVTSSIAVTAKVVAKGGIQGPTAIKANLSTDKVTADVDGSITDLTTASAISLNLALKAASLADVGDLAGAPLPRIGPLEVNTTVERDANAINLGTLVVVLGNSDLKGNLSVKLPGAGTKGDATGLFKSKVLDINELVEALPKSPPQQQAESTQAPVESTSKLAEETTAGGNASVSNVTGIRVFPDDPLSVELLARYDSYIELSVDEVKLLGVTVEHGRATLDLKDSALKVNLHRGAVGGRPIEGLLTLDASRQPAPLSFDFHADKIPLSDVLVENSLLQGGRIFVDVDTEGSGNSVREIMAGLNGHASLALVDTRLSSTLFSRFGKDLLSQINPLSASKGYSEIECAAAAFDIRDGIASTPRGLVSRDKSATWIGNGDIDLRTEQINISFESRPREGLGINAATLASLVQLGGTLASPTVTPNPVGVAKTGAEAVLAISTGGISLLATGFLKRATSEQEVCEAILQTIILGKNPTGGTEPASKDKEN